MAKHKTANNGKAEAQKALQQHFHRLEAMVSNELSTRRKIFEKFLDSRRDIDSEAGYPDEVSPEQFRRLYDREGIATRLISVWPKECWAQPPEVFETAEEDVTPFEQAFMDLGASLIEGVESEEGLGFAEDDSHPLWSYLERVDELSGIGRYGVLLLGLNDGLDLEKEAKPKEGMELLFVRPFDETTAKVASTNMDIASPRLGRPEFYNITLTGDGSTTKTVKVHWSRVIHVADNRKSSQVYGVPRLQSMYNRMYDIRKILAGSGEMFWQGGFMGISFETQDGEGGAVSIDTTNLKDEIEDYFNHLQRYLALEGITAKSLAPQIADPTAHFKVQMEAVAIAAEIPMRILMGSERGELASSQDERNWYRKVGRRQRMYLTPMLVRPTINRLIGLGVLPRPDKYGIKWPDLWQPSSLDKATYSKTITEALARYVDSGAEAVMPLPQFLTKVMDYSLDEAESIIEEVEEREAELEAEREEMGTATLGDEEIDEDEEE